MQPTGADARPRKTMIVLTGFDGTGEELYFQTGQAALERGWNVLLAEGPGQTGFLRFHPDVGFRPDYEKPVGAMIDRSEEHTSELQSRQYLVCRLLLEKKKKNKNKTTDDTNQ